MTNRRRVSTAELKRLHKEEKLSLRQIAKRLGILEIAVRQGLVNAGVRIRGDRNEPRELDGEQIKQLYVVEGVTREEIARRLKTSSGNISEILRANGVTKRYQGAGRRKYPDISRLKIGESVRVPKPVGGGKWQTRFYNSAACSGVRVSVRQIDDFMVEVTRIDDQPKNPRIPNTRRPDLSTDYIRRLYAGGLSLEQIAKKVGIARPSVTGRLKKAGVVLRRPGGQRKEFDSEMLKRLYLEEKLTVAQIAKRLGSARRTVANFLKENGVTVRSNKRQNKR